MIHSRSVGVIEAVTNGSNYHGSFFPGAIVPYTEDNTAGVIASQQSQDIVDAADSEENQVSATCVDKGAQDSVFFQRELGPALPWDEP